ncbi:SRPBCC domain-containing protein [Candidatus Gracilibacteria bacterium]|nr:SRPBCC domain-containing protein [Candidatus Gracilibacteria bacterium]
MDNTLFTSRIFPYSVEVIFSKYSNPLALARWWGPHGFTNIFESFNFTQGGKWIFTMIDGTNIYPNEMIFRHIEPNRIVMEHTVMPHFTLEVLLEKIDDKNTKMTWNATFESVEFLSTMKDFLIQKNGENFDRLEEELKNF